MAIQPVSRFLASRRGIILIGAVIGVLAPLLQKFGNPANMGICVACFERDIVGALGLHRAAVVQYIRPEIPGFILGSLMAALFFKDFRARCGSAPLVRFVLGFCAMVGALVFLGCPWRTLLRLAGGDLNAILGIVGLTIGIAIGDQFLKHGYTLGRSRSTYTSSGLIMPAFALGLLLLLVFAPQLSASGPIFFSEKGPGSMHAPIILSLAVGLIVGIIAQRTRFCTMGSIRDVLLVGDLHLMSGIIALTVAAFGTNLVLGQVHVGFSAQPVAHSNHIWNLLGMVLAGLAFVLAGGCPGRQLILSGEGDTDAAVFVLGMLTGAAFAHNFALASGPDSMVDGVLKVGGPSIWGMWAVAVGIVICLLIGWSMREKTEEAA